MFVRIRFASLPRWGRHSLVLALGVAPLFASCATSEDTEPFVPSVEGAKQPDDGGDLVSEEDACDRLRRAALDAYERLDCTTPEYPACPAFLRPAGGSGCYEYRADSIESCEQTYDEATSCRLLSPCLATAELDTDLPTCDLLVADGSGGAGGAGAGAGGIDTGGSAAGGNDAGGMGPVIEGGSPGVAGQPSGAGASGEATGGVAG
jgi:hypothetical protein